MRCVSWRMFLFHPRLYRIRRLPALSTFLNVRYRRRRCRPLSNLLLGLMEDDWRRGIRYHEHSGWRQYRESLSADRGR